MRKIHRLLSLTGSAVALGLFLVFTPAGSAAAKDSSDRHGRETGRIVAIGDIHGAFDPFVEILRATGLVDEENNWAGGETTLVQTGDFTDRGADVRAVMDLLIELQRQAPDHGGEVIVLLANHETMNLASVYRDVSPAAMVYFGDDDSERRRQEAWERQIAIESRRAEMRGEPPPTLTDEDREEWLAELPLGLIEYAAALGPGGEYGRWLRSLPTVVQIDGTIFMHAGIEPQHSSMSLEEINERVWEEVETHDRIKREMVEAGLIHPHSTLREMTSVARELRQAFIRRAGAGEQLSPTELALGRTFDELLREVRRWFLLLPEGPLWTRGPALWTYDEGDPQLTEVLQAYGAQRFVVGHTPMRDGRIRTRLDDRVFLIDTGMLTEVYGGQAAALEILEGKFTAVYTDGREVLVEPDEESTDCAAASRQTVVCPRTLPALEEAAGRAP